MLGNEKNRREPVVLVVDTYHEIKRVLILILMIMILTVLLKYVIIFAERSIDGIISI